MPRRRLVMIAVVVLALAASGVLMVRGEGLTGPVVLVALAGVVLLQLDTRKRLASLGTEQRRTASLLQGLRRDHSQARSDRARAGKAERTIADVHKVTTKLAESIASSDARRIAIDARIDASRSRQESWLRSLVRNSQTPTQAQAQLQLQALFAPEAPLPVVAGWAMEPTALMELVDVVRRHRPRLVVECGSGTSTLWIAYALRRNGFGRVVALDHLPEFAAATRQALADHDLTEWAEVRDAPLAPTQTPRGTMPWYDIDPSDLAAIDLLVVDGPPTATGDLARYPALPVLAHAIGPDSRIMFDDANRDDEQAVLREWREHWDLEVERDVAGRALLLKLAAGADSAGHAGDDVRSASGDGVQ